MGCATSSVNAVEVIRSEGRPTRQVQPGERHVTVQKRRHSPLGIELLTNPSDGLIVTQVKSGGILSEAVKMGDRILAVNGVSGNRSALRLLRSEGTLDLLIKDGEPASKRRAAAHHLRQHLQQRSFGPEDFELLLALDEAQAEPGDRNAEQSIHCKAEDLLHGLPRFHGSDFPEAECAICLEDISPNDELVQLPCKHMFHTGCADCWLSRRKRCCPMCMSELESPAIATPSTSAPLA
eukprot:TRINITY_DN15205_c0_g1_i1.p1 TRINITY_DN15205_c0_g1~~TRINITY_DN15205_c0_g1_i1.p1  ORF type:complete len:260 (+),score=41.17 TRINITY_DN15205_c0_g1_i1:72-782(+)